MRVIVFRAAQMMVKRECVAHLQGPICLFTLLLLADLIEAALLRKGQAVYSTTMGVNLKAQGGDAAALDSPFSQLLSDVIDIKGHSGVPGEETGGLFGVGTDKGVGHMRQEEKSPCLS
jgi:hypothetical protein